MFPGRIGSRVGRGRSHGVSRVYEDRQRIVNVYTIPCHSLTTSGPIFDTGLIDFYTTINLFNYNQSNRFWTLRDNLERCKVETRNK